MRGDDDREGHRARNRQVDAALLDDERLPEADDREDGSEREHAQQRSFGDAGGGNEGAQHEQADDEISDGRSMHAVTPPTVR